MHKLIKKYLPIALLTVLAVSCGKQERFFPKEMTPVKIEIVRMDSAILNLPTDSAGIEEGIDILCKEQTQGIQIFSEDVLGIYDENFDELASELLGFLNDTVYGFKEINKLVKEEFADVSDIQKDFDEAFTRLHYLYPEWQLPTLYFMVSGFTSNAWGRENQVFVIGTDMYMGKDFPYYNNVVYEYQKKQMERENIAVHVVRTYIDQFFFDKAGNRMIDRILYEGRLCYMMQQVMPGKTKAQIMGYTDEEIRWCEKFEKQIWGVICDKQDLFTTNRITIGSYVNDGPFTSEVSQESPARLGIWVGWRIVESYMKNHPEMSLQQMMELEDSQIILQESKYRP